MQQDSASELMDKKEGLGKGGREGVSAFHAIWIIHSPVFNQWSGKKGGKMAFPGRQFTFNSLAARLF